MALPTYNKTMRRRAYEQLPKGAYVVKILGAKEEPNKTNGGSHLSIAFDIAEGEYTGFYGRQFQNDANKDRKWPNDGMYYLTVPQDNSKDYVWANWHTFFADLEDSNGGFIFSGNLQQLKGKLLGGKFRIEQNEYQGQVYNHTRLEWTCVADDIRNGKAGTLPNDKLIAGSKPGTTGRNNNPFIDNSAIDDFVNIPDGLDEELPF